MPPVPPAAGTISADPGELTPSKAVELLAFEDIHAKMYGVKMLSLREKVKQVDFAEEFLENDGLNELLKVASRKDVSYALQGMCLKVIVELLVYENAMDQVTESQEMVDRIYSILTIPGVMLTASKPTLEILVVLCGQKEDGYKMVMSSAESKHGMAMKPYTCFISLLGSDDLSAVKPTLLLMIYLIKKVKQHEDDVAVKQLLFQWKDSGLLSVVQRVSDRNYDDPDIKKSLHAFQQLSSVTIPRSWEEAAKFQAKFEEMRKRCEEQGEALFVFQQQQAKMRLMRLELAKAQDTIKAMNLLSPGASTNYHPSKRFSDGGGIPLSALCGDNKVVESFDFESTAKEIAAARKAVFEQFAKDNEFRPVAEKMFGGSGGGGGGGRAGRSRRLDPFADVDDFDAPPPPDDDEDAPPPDDDDFGPPPDDDYGPPPDDEYGPPPDDDYGPPPDDEGEGPPGAPGSSGAGGGGARPAPAGAGQAPQIAPDGTVIPPTDPGTDPGYAAAGGAVVAPAGAVVAADGSVVAADGTVVAPAGTVAAAAAGAVVAADGSVVAADGTVIAAAGTVVTPAPAGAVVAADGSVVAADGTVVAAAGAGPSPQLGEQDVASGGAPAATAAAAPAPKFGAPGGAPPPPPPPPPGFGGARAGGPPPPPPKFGMGGGGKAKDERQFYHGKAPEKKMKPFHWEKMGLPAGENSLWFRIHEKKEYNLEFDYEEFESMYSQKEVTATASDKPEKKKKVILIDGQVFQNLSIMLHKLPTIPNIQRSILELDDQSLSRDSLVAIVAQIPAADVVKQFNAQQDKKPVEEYEPPEQFVALTQTLPAFRHRCATWLFTMEYEDDVAGVIKPIVRVTEAIEVVLNSKYLPYYFGLLLGFGNMMNHGNAMKGNAAAIPLGTLGKLDGTKDNRGKVSLMQHLFNCVKKENPEALDLHEELKPILNNVANVKFDDLEKGAGECERNLKQFQNQVSTVKRQMEKLGTAADDCYVPKMAEFTLKAEARLKEATEQFSTCKEKFKQLQEYLACKAHVKSEDIFQELVPFIERVKKEAVELAKDKKRAQKKGKKIGNELGDVVGKLQEDIVE